MHTLPCNPSTYELDGLRVREHGIADYESVWHAMQEFTHRRPSNCPDELWVVEHHPVFTLGQAGDRAHVLDPGLIPIVFSDRGGQVTYHGPGQIVVYALVDLRRRGLGVRRLVDLLEQSVIDLLFLEGVVGERRSRAPGVYVQQKKIAALGLRVKRGCSYHGLALNVDMDLAPFSRINPCGYAGLQVTQLVELGVSLGLQETAAKLVRLVATSLYQAGTKALE